MAEKSHKRKSNRKRKPKRKRKPCGACILISLLAGNTDIVKAYFYKMIRTGRFQNIRKHYGSCMDMFAEELCNEVYLAILKKFNKGLLRKIEKPSSFIWNIVRYRSIDEDRRLRKIIHFSRLFDQEEEHGYPEVI
jgi:DNA-directed RNA polymerase specialized sigma24 family protein